MAGIARVVMTGNLTRDPELRHTPSGMAICSLSVAINSREKRNGEWSDYVSYFDATCFGNTAEACAQYLTKGAKVAIDGRLRQERWEKDGVKRYAVKVMIDTIEFPPRGEGTSGGGGGQRQGQQTVGSAPESEVTFEAPQADFSNSDDDIPF